MKKNLTAFLLAAFVGFVASHAELVPQAEAAPKFKSTFLNGPADGGPSTPVCFGYVDAQHPSTQHVITFEANTNITGFCFKTCPSTGGTPTAPTATIATCAANCSQDYVPPLNPLGTTTLTDGGIGATIVPTRYTTSQFDMASDNCVSIAPTDATAANDGGVRLYDVTLNNITHFGGH